MSDPSTAVRVLFLCTGNSCRSQMAEGWLRARGGDAFVVASAGLVARGLDPRAVRAMAERGVDISAQDSTPLGDLQDFRPDLVITVCGHADEHCPVFPTDVEKRHVPFDDPPRLAADAADEEAAMAAYRRVRDEIGSFVETLVAERRRSPSLES